MKKVISVLLVLVLAFGACVPAFAHSAQQAGECSDLPVVIVRGMDFNGLRALITAPSSSARQSLR